MRLEAFECPSCGARFRRDEYVKLWTGAEAALERPLRKTLESLGLRCTACERSVADFVTVWAPT